MTERMHRRTASPPETWESKEGVGSLPRGHGRTWSPCYEKSTSDGGGASRDLKDASVENHDMRLATEQTHLVGEGVEDGGSDDLRPDSFSRLIPGLATTS